MRDGSLKYLIYKHLRSRPGVKVNGGEIEKLAEQNGYKAETGDRRARELPQEGRRPRNTGKEGGFVLSKEKPGKDVASILFWYQPSKYEVYHQQRQHMPLL